MFDLLTLCAHRLRARRRRPLHLLGLHHARARHAAAGAWHRAMQSINVVIINPWFLGVFVGTAAACAIVLAWGIAQGGVTSSIGALAGSLSISSAS